MSNNNDISIPTSTNVLIIGGGPGGSMAATFLAREGFNVTLLEQTKFPRYHIGESLLNLTNIYKLAGLVDKIRNYGFIRKHDELFKINSINKLGRMNYRGSDIIGETYHVTRADFDKMLLDHAKEAGAKIFEETVVTNVVFENDTPILAEWKNARGHSGNIQFDYVIDATGASGLFAKKLLKNIHPQKSFSNVILGSYWRNYRGDFYYDGADYPSPYYMEVLTEVSGWLWAIPLHNNTLSLGIVMHQNAYQTLFQELKSNQAVYEYVVSLSKHNDFISTESAQIGEVIQWDNYSCAADTLAGNRFRLIGDAAGFIDPFGSTGVHLAIYGALSAAASISSSLKKECTEKEAYSFHDKCVRASYTRFLIITASIYKNIIKQDDYIFPAIKMEDLENAFTMLMPVIKKDNNEYISDEQVSKIMDYTSEMFNQQFGFGTTNVPAKILSTLAKYHFQDEGLLGMDYKNPINDCYMRMQKGNLGLAKITEIMRLIIKVRLFFVKLILKYFN